MKKIIIGLLCIVAISLLASNLVFASDNTFVGTDTMSEDLDTCIDDIIDASSISDIGRLTEDEIEYSHTQKIFEVSPSDLFKEKSINSNSLKAIIENSEYFYEMRIYRRFETFYFTIEKGHEPDPELIKQGLFPDEEIARMKENVGKWQVGGHGVSSYPLDPAGDYLGLMESYLQQKDIHNAEVYFIGPVVDPESTNYAVVLTGKTIESGEDEMIFVGLDMLGYDGEGNLVYDWYDKQNPDYTEAEYTYKELRKMYKEKNQNPAVYIAIAAGVISIAGVITIVRKRIQR